MADSENRKLPKGWRMVRFGDVVRETKEKVDRDNTELSRFVAGEHMDSGDFHLRRWGEITGDYLGPAFHRAFKKGQILYGSRRTYLKKVAIAPFDGICANTTFVLESRDLDDLLPELLPFLMLTDAFTEHAVRESRGSTNPYVVWGDIAKYAFPLPPKDEQRRIAEILWAADDAINSYFAAMSAADQYHRLTIADSLKAAQAFPVARLVSVIDASRPLCYGIVQPGTFDPNGVPFVRVCDMEGGQIAIDFLERVDKSVSDQYSRSIIRENDVLVSIVGTIGRVAKVTKDADGFNIARAVARLAPGPQVMPDFLLFVLRSDQLQRSLVGESVETARKTLNLGALAELLIPLPSLELQCQLISRVAASQSACDRIRRHLDVLKRTADTFRNSFLTPRPSDYVH